MEGTTTIVGYHTCQNSGSWKFIWDNTPFLSEENERQWLTQGYYFWTDSDHFAHLWGKQSYKNNYAIVRCNIEIDRLLILDLVGSVETQLYFRDILQEFYKKLKKADPNAMPPTISAVISFYREQQKEMEGVFPFLAIKTEEDYVNKDQQFRFIDNYQAYLTLPKRQQLCLFAQAYGCIKSKQPIFPDEFKQQIDYENIK